MTQITQKNLTISFQIDSITRRSSCVTARGVPPTACPVHGVSCQGGRGYPILVLTGGSEVPGCVWRKGKGVLLFWSYWGTPPLGKDQGQRLGYPLPLWTRGLDLCRFSNNHVILWQVGLLLVECEHLSNYVMVNNNFTRMNILSCPNVHIIMPLCDTKWTIWKFVCTYSMYFKFFHSGSIAFWTKLH